MVNELEVNLREQLVITCRTTLGDNLRSITYFDQNAYEQIYLRSDLDQDADLRIFSQHEWREFKHIREIYDESELGEYQYTVRKFENGFLIRIGTSKQGVFATTDGLTTQSFAEVAKTLDKILSR
jgi:hypothetical protein